MELWSKPVDLERLKEILAGLRRLPSFREAMGESFFMPIPLRRLRSLEGILPYNDPALPTSLVVAVTRLSVPLDSATVEDDDEAEEGNDLRVALSQRHDLVRKSPPKCRMPEFRAKEPPECSDGDVGERAWPNSGELKTLVRSSGDAGPRSAVFVAGRDEGDVPGRLSAGG